MFPSPLGVSILLMADIVRALETVMEKVSVPSRGFCFLILKRWGVTDEAQVSVSYRGFYSSNNKRGISILSRIVSVPSRGFYFLIQGWHFEDYHGFNVSVPSRGFYFLIQISNFQ